MVMNDLLDDRTFLSRPNQYKVNTTQCIDSYWQSFINTKKEACDKAKTYLTMQRQEFIAFCVAWNIPLCVNDPSGLRFITAADI